MNKLDWWTPQDLYYLAEMMYLSANKLACNFYWHLKFSLKNVTLISQDDTALAQYWLNDECPPPGGMTEHHIHPESDVVTRLKQTNKQTK